MSDTLKPDDRRFPAMLEVQSRQRNSALDAIVHQAGEIAVLQARVAELEAALKAAEVKVAELTPAPQEPE